MNESGILLHFEHQQGNGVFGLGFFFLGGL